MNKYLYIRTYNLHCARNTVIPTLYGHMTQYVPFGTVTNSKYSLKNHTQDLK